MSHAKHLARNPFDKPFTATFTCDAAGIVLDCNLALNRLLGEPDAHALNLVEHVQTREMAQLVLRRARQLGKVEHQYLRLKSTHGEERLVLANIAWIEDPTTPHFKGELLDMTEYHQVRQELANAQRLGAVGQLTSAVAHDFNNVLSIIMGYADILLAEAGDREDLRGLVAEVEHAARRGAELSRQLLAFNRKLVGYPRVLDLNLLLRNFEKMLVRVIGETIQWESHYDERVGNVMADDGQLEQVILNLILNARDAVEDGGRIILRTEIVEANAPMVGIDRTLPAGSYATIAVSDNGQGLHPDVKEQIFKPFFTTKGPERGTGLGLATCRTLVRQWDGMVTVESEPGEGATFKVFLPRTQLAPEHAQPALTAESVRRRDATILVVEDEANVLEVITQVLRRAGYRVHGAAGAAAARELIAGLDEAVHLLLADVVLPDGNGPELAAELTETYPRLQVLFTSGYSQSATERYGIQRDSRNFLPKPFTVNQLTAKVEQTLELA